MRLPGNEPETQRAFGQPSVMSAAIGLIDAPVRERTLMDIAKELEEAKMQRDSASDALELANARITKLNAEVRNFGRKPRAKRGTP